MTGDLRNRRARADVPTTAHSFSPVAARPARGTVNRPVPPGGSIARNHRLVAQKAGELGGFLRARRQQVRPEDVGLIAGARRRVAGLRREELAMLAGISAEYYLRLEVGRDKNPSAHVIEALARALRLDVEATEYIHRLAGVTGSCRASSAMETVADGLDQMIDLLPTPAFVASGCGPGRVGRQCVCPRAVTGV